jgi:hypothetical protein
VNGEHLTISRDGTRPPKSRSVKLDVGAYTGKLQPEGMFIAALLLPGGSSARYDQQDCS